ncbi:MAG TPA: DUF2065 family protein [archaeon]|nr:DUF2065 family protein [archaeon]HLD81565.1 DUF2065 family protein [archaeon]
MDQILAVFGLLLAVKGLLMVAFTRQVREAYKRLGTRSNAYLRVLGAAVFFLGAAALWLSINR